MRKLMTGAIAASLLLVAGTAIAGGDAAAGKAKFAMCMGCHGANGVPTAPTYPPLAGKDAAYISEQLNAFRSGKRDNATMKAMAGGLTDADVANLAAYIGTLPKP